MSVVQKQENEFNLQKSLKQAKSSKFKNFSTDLLFWYDEVKVSHPWREFWEEHQDPYHVWVSEVMLQQTLIRVVTPIYVRFIKKFPTARSLADAKEEEIRAYVKGLGYYSRFDRLHRAVKILCEASTPLSWPNGFSEWKKLPGIGDYTASAITSIAFNEVRAVLDGNVERVLSRLFMISEPINSPSMKKDLQKICDVLVSTDRPGDYNQALMELGQTHCSKSEPSCESCPVSSCCLARRKNVQNTLPNIVKRKAREDLDLFALVVKKRGKIFLSNREGDSPFLKNRPGFPLLKNLKKKPLKKDLIGTYKHSITHHNIKVHVISCEESSLSKKEEGVWVGMKDLESKLMTSLDMKAFKQIELL